MTNINHSEVKLTAPPEPDMGRIQPAILTVGPQLTMLLSAAVSLFTTLTNIANRNASFSTAIQQLYLHLLWQ